MIIIAKSLHELSDSIVYLNLNCGGRHYPTEFQTYDEAWNRIKFSCLTR